MLLAKRSQHVSVYLSNDGYTDKADKLICFVLAALFLVFSNLSTAANDLDNSNKSKENQDMIGALIFDRTVTYIGHAFYQRFCQIWREQNSRSIYNLSVHEGLSSKMVKQLSIKYKEKTIHTIPLSPNNKLSDKNINELVTVISKRINRINVESFLSDNLDLAKDEI